jgi:hypothetical protein
VAVMFRVMKGDHPKQSSDIPNEVWTLMTECWRADPDERPFAAQIVSRLRGHTIGAVPTDAAHDWDRWRTAKFRSSLQEHTLFGRIDNWLPVSHWLSYR